MIGKNNRALKVSKQGTKVETFGIKKFKAGAASVLIGASIFFGAGVAAASEDVANNTTNANTTAPAVEKEATAPKVEEAAAPKAEESKEVATPEVAQAPKAAEVKAEEKTPASVDKSTLEANIARLESALSAVDTAKAPASTVAKAKEVLANAKASAANTAATAEEVATLAKRAGEQAYVISAMPKAGVEKKEAKEGENTIANSGKNDPRNGQSMGEEGVSLRSQTFTGKGVIRQGNAIVNVQNTYVTMNDNNTAPQAWGIDVVFDTTNAKAGDTTTIELTNLWEFGRAFDTGTEIKAADGTVIGTVTAKDYSTSTGHNNNNSSPFWGQRTQRGKTFAERVAESPAVANETGTYKYTITWNDKASNYAVTTYATANLTGDGYIRPQISEDTDYVATIKVDGETILSHTYKATKTAPNNAKQSTGVSLSTNNGLTYVNNELTGRSDTININTDTDIRYGVGSKFTITLPNTDFTEFKVFEGNNTYIGGLNPASTLTPNHGDSITYRPANRWSGAVANANNVWILQDGRDIGFTLTPTLLSPTQLVLEVTEGALQEGSIIAIPLEAFGVQKVLKDRTFSSEFSDVQYDELGRIVGKSLGRKKNSEGTLTVTGGTSVNGEPENVSTNVTNGWDINASVGNSSAAQTGAVVMTLTDITTGKVIGYVPTEYNGQARINEDGTYETKNILGKPYDTTKYIPELVKMIDNEEYVLVNLPPLGPTGTINLNEQKARDIFTPEELEKHGIAPGSSVNNVIYSYVKKTKEDDVKRTIKFVYADDVANLAGQEVHPSVEQTVSYTGVVKLNAEGKVEVDSKEKPIYIDWKAKDGITVLPELQVPAKEGFIPSITVVAAQATNPEEEDYEVIVTYTAAQKATTTFVYQDQDGKEKVVDGNTPISETGKAGESLTKAAEVAEKIKEALKQGYELVSNDYPTNGVFDNDPAVDQNYTVTLKERTEPVQPTDPKTPGTPVDPTDPEGPKWPSGVEESDLNKTVTRKITYVYADGSPVLENGQPKVVEQSAKFSRSATVNLVTGKVTYGDWTAAQELAEVESPFMKGYIVDKKVVEKLTATNESENSEVVVTYTPVGNWIPQLPNGDKPQLPYEVDPKDPSTIITPDPENPTKPGVPAIPHVPGYTPKDPKGNPLKPVDPTDPSKGYIPPVPENPTENTVITYAKDEQKAIVKYVVEGGKELETYRANLTGKSGEAIEYSTKETLDKLIELGYELVKDEFTTATDKNYDNDSTKDQEFVVTIKEKVVPVPVDPENPVKPTPGQPIDPENPTGPKWTEELINKLDNGRTITRTVNYVNEAREVVSKQVTDKVVFTRSAKINVVTKEITYDGEWTAANNDTTFDAVKSPVVEGYILKANQDTQGGLVAADGTEVAETTGLTQDSANQNLNVVYVKLGSWIPKIPGQDVPSIIYPNDPKDPTKPGTDRPNLPYVPGYTPKDPEGNPLKPVDPKDPSKGYIAPDPKDPTRDTVITYERDPQPKPRPEKPTNEDPQRPTVGKKQLPNTDATNSTNTAAGLGMLGALMALAVKRGRKDK